MMMQKKMRKKSYKILKNIYIKKAFYIYIYIYLKKIYYDIHVYFYTSSAASPIIMLANGTICSAINFVNRSENTFSLR